MDSIVLLYNKEMDKVVKGKVTYYKDWFDKWKRGEKWEILSIEFENGETPFGLEKEDIQGVYDQVDEKFKEKMGINYEEFCDWGAPNYEDFMKKVKEKRFKQIQNGVRAKNGVDEIEKLKEEVKKAEEKLAELEKREKFLKMEEELRKNGKIKLDKLLGEIEDKKLQRD